MNTQMFGTAISLLLVGILSIAASSIALECYNKNESMKNEKKDNYNFLIVNLVVAIIMVLVSFASMYLAVKPF